MPHLSLHELKAELATHGVHVSHDTVWRFLRREGLRYKNKSLHPLSRKASTSAAITKRPLQAWRPDLKRSVL